VKPTSAFIIWVISLSGQCAIAEVGVFDLNARNTGNIKKSGKLLNCWMTWKAGSKDRSGVMMKWLIASTVSKNSSMLTQKDAAGVDRHD